MSIGSGFILIKSSIAAKSPLLETANSSLKQNATNNRLPRQVADAVLRDASEWSGLSTVSNGRDSYIYRIKQDGSQFKLQGQTGTIETVKPESIPASELPPPLDRGELFREIATGRNSGTTYQTVLLDDGLLIRVRIGDANDSERIIQRVSPQQLRLFKALLNRSRAQFNNLNYQAKTGDADYITYTLTSHNGTVQYSDLSSNGLPAKLRVAVEAWNQLRGSAREIGR